MIENVYIADPLPVLVDRCSKPKYQFIRISTLKLRDVAVLQHENPFWRLKSIYLIQDPRARLAGYKRLKKFVDNSGVVRQYTKRSYKVAVDQICSHLAEDLEHTADFESPRIIATLQAYLVKEEDLFSDLEQEMRGILSTLNIPWTKSMENMIKSVEFPEDGGSKTKLQADFEQELQNLDAWKTELNREEIFAVERNLNCRKVFNQAGYEFHDF
ncbi:uncharacterized protein LOC111696364 [Eurytemora carolleeae]|uniref:uncharacterized protein LOC111696364 n=1 Tax=Eurytemora carolleeae TaxID=1294199 RepID=UPI000C76DF42|nr:uncharacterized protein LOC111696364 [Eurytemora carolleeae]|eukprot:XP_023321723.1 uncharacterized protein LOC111696364 [Eurytemora affinis]